MTIDCYTSAGVLDHNDDSFIALECHDGEGYLVLGIDGKMTENTVRFDCGDFILCAVSDGVGSSARGGEASAMVVSELFYSVERIVDSEDPIESIICAVKTISDTVADDLDSSGKATLVGYLGAGDRGYIFNTGDSLAEASCGRWRYRSLEHNVRNTRGCLEDHPNARKLTEYIGKRDPRVDVDVSSACDRVVLYSDGAAVHGSLLDASGSCRDLVEGAVAKGSTDNVTVVTYEKD